MCVDVCPVEGCIRFENNLVSVKTEDCIGCGICTTVCPTSALVMDNLSDSELLTRLNAAGIERSTDNPSDMVFGCTLGTKVDDIANRKSQIANHINLPCLAILKESHLISLILSGIQNIYLDLARCSECSFKHGKKTIERTTFYARNMLDAVGKHDYIKEVSKQGSEGKTKSRLLSGKTRKNKAKNIIPEPEYSRRELLSFFRAKAVEKAVERVTGNKKTNEGGIKREHGIPERRTILMDALNLSLQVSGRDMSTLQPAQVEEGMFPVHQIKIESNCTLCKICSLFCPTGAIIRFEGDKEVRLDFNIALCMDCFECTELCPDSAMSKEKIIDLALLNNEVKTLFKKGSEKCPSCNRTFFPEDGAEECNICRKRKHADEMMFGFAPVIKENAEKNLIQSGGV
ncbi:MAG: hypothetical protein A2073_06025 [Deltaproteobacteria bacterium GWC2_42_11]|nr:MAG: hypothetical protein A2073_06025 [Deltaproteobacteria bacterium GWC2_42_11]